ncbi:MAG: hypothetical protein ACP5VS_07745 [Desulfomonilaceae bacterium]
MGKKKHRLVSNIFRIMLVPLLSLLFVNPVNAQTQQWIQEELTRQNYQKQQLLQWQREQQIRQMYDRQQQLQWQQQEKLRQMYLK